MQAPALVGAMPAAVVNPAQSGMKSPPAAAVPAVPTGLEPPELAPPVVALAVPATPTLPVPAVGVLAVPAVGVLAMPAVVVVVVVEPLAPAVVGESFEPEHAAAPRQAAATRKITEMRVVRSMASNPLKRDDGSGAFEPAWAAAQLASWRLRVRANATKAGIDPRCRAFVEIAVI